MPGGEGIVAGQTNADAHGISGPLSGGDWRLDFCGKSISSLRRRRRMLDHVPNGLGLGRSWGWAIKGEDALQPARMPSVPTGVLI